MTNNSITHKSRETVLTVEEPGKVERVMNRISGTSRFHSFKVPNELYLPENQLRVACILRDGWLRVRHFPPGTKFRIYQSGELVA